MSVDQEKQQQLTQWEAYRADELVRARTSLTAKGFALDDAQVHIGGERYLMSGRKLVLTGTRVSDGIRVIIKFSSDAAGREEIRVERNARAALQRFRFSYRTFFAPEELLFEEKDGCTIAVTEFIREDRAFLVHDNKEQFFLALRAFETQEGLHVTTFDHAQAIRGIFGVTHATEYVRDLEKLFASIESCLSNDVARTHLLARAKEFFISYADIVDRYADFLTHTDFVPHNLRIVDHDIYLLDHASIRFGNKYESWARFLNYCIIHNPQLERWLTQYVKENRGEEYLSLRLMRVYKVVYLIDFYARSLAKTTGDLHALGEARVGFWTTVLSNVLDDVPVSDQTLAEYKNIRDRLRSEEEKTRQRALKQLT